MCSVMLLAVLSFGSDFQIITQFGGLRTVLEILLYVTKGGFLNLTLVSVASMCCSLKTSEGFTTFSCTTEKV